LRSSRISVPSRTRASKGEEHGEPAVNQKAGIDIERMRRMTRSCDCADDKAEKLQREKRPGDRLQTGRVRGDERVAARTVSPIASSRLRTT
jgi:hypothetical protein